MLGIKTMIILSKDTLLKDLVDMRSTIYSTHPDLYIGRMLSGGLRMVIEVLIATGAKPPFTT
jgi:glutaredoxin-related protein